MPSALAYFPASDLQMFGFLAWQINPIDLRCSGRDAFDMYFLSLIG
jgi:hypothetical protein